MRRCTMATSPRIVGIELGDTKYVALLATGPDDVGARVTIPTSDPAATLAGIEAVLEG